MGHSSYVIDLCISADNRQYRHDFHEIFQFFFFSLISGSYDKTLKQWDSQSGECLNTFRGHENSVYGVCLSPDSKLVFSASPDKSCRMWEVIQNETIEVLKLSHFGKALVFLMTVWSM